jgi:hypothetical protein
LEAQSPRLFMIAEKVAKKADTAYKMIQRFLAECDPCPAWLRLFQEEAEFVLGDVTEMPRPGARKTAYGGTLRDGKTLGYWLLILSTPFRGRAIPFHFVTYSREFSYLELLQILFLEAIHFVIRLKVGAQHLLAVDENR